MSVQLARSAAKNYKDIKEFQEKDSINAKILQLYGIEHDFKQNTILEVNCGNKIWRKDGILHHHNAPAILWSNGDEDWYFDGDRHRIGGPALDHVNGHKEWWYYGKLHRLDGAAIIFINGDKSWYINGVKMSESKHRENVKTV